jgi:hypothetical protein
MASARDTRATEERRIGTGSSRRKTDREDKGRKSGLTPNSREESAAEGSDRPPIQPI